MNDLTEMDWTTVEKALREALSQGRSMLEQAGLRTQVDDIWVLIDAGEYGVALEQLVSHLAEINQPFSLHIYERVEQAGTLMKMNPSTWEILRSLAKDG